VKTHYKTFWRPERAHIVVVGDVTRAEVEPLLTRAFGAWRAAPPPPELAKVPPPAAARPRLVLVDRPDAPQAVLALVRPGVAASAPEYAALTRANFALGGSFTSRLNQELREKRGFTYGARSRVAAGRETGMVVASAAVHTEVTGEAAELLLANVRDFAASGLTPEEIDKTRSQARAELVEVFEAVTSTASRFAQDAALLLPPNFQTELSTRRDQADKAALDAAVKQAYDTGAATLVVVGPAAKVEEQLRRLNLGPAERRDAEGKKLDAPKSRCEGKRC
jgi:predicted Zn-dependent peptidase